MTENDIIVKSNALVKSTYKLSYLEHSMMLLILSRLNKNEKLSDQCWYKIGVADVADIVGRDIRELYQDVKQAAARLMDRKVYIHELPNGGGKLVDKNGDDMVLVTGWVQAMTYVDSQAYIEFKISKEIIPYISQLKVQFTKYRLDDVRDLKTAYGVRLYEILMQWKNRGQVELRVDEFKDLLFLGKEYKRIGDLKLRVIIPCVEDINTNTNLHVEWDQRQQGRRVTHFIFNFRDRRSKLTEIKKLL